MHLSAPFMNVSKKRIIMKSFIESEFGYCPLIWMLNSRELNNKINRIHERAIEIYKVMQGISPPLLNKALAPRQYNYELRGNNF